MDIQLLGPVRICCGDTVHNVGVRKRRFVLAVLALEVNQLVTVDRLIDLLWPDAPPANARGIIHGHISGLRKTLTALGPAAQGVSLRREGTAYLLTCDPAQVDIHRFDKLVGRAGAETDPVRRLALLDEALRLWRGPVLADAATEPVRGQLARHFDDTRLTVTEDRLDILMRLGHDNTAIDELTKLVDTHPYRHRLTELLMIALHRVGRSEQALALYREAKCRLADDLGLDPPDHLQQLEMAILRNDSALHVRTDRATTSPGQDPTGSLPQTPPDSVVGGRTRRTTAPDLDELTASVSITVRKQWTDAAIERRLLTPAPLPIRWRPCSLPVTSPLTAATAPQPTGGSFDPLPGLERVTHSQLWEGTHATLYPIYGGLASGRLILTGGPGTGKTSAAILLLLDALRHRDNAPLAQRAQIPAPVLFTLHGWNPDTTPLRDWLTTKLTELPPLTRRHGRRYADHLLTTGRIAVFLDGLDEIAAPHRTTALRALSQQATFRLVLLTRTTELAVAAEQNILTGAAALELKPLRPADAATYLQHALPDPPPPPWRHLITTLTTDTGTPIARALNNPLTITLLRDIHQPTSGPEVSAGTVDDLLDTTRFPTPDHITHHLLDHAISTAYTPQPGQPPPPYTPDTARRTLTLIAQQLRDHNTRDLEWWTICDWTPPAFRAMISAVLGAFTSALVVVLGVGLAVVLNIDPLVRLGGGITGRLVVGLVSGCAIGLMIGLMGTRKPSLIDKTRWRRTTWRQNFRFGFVPVFVTVVVAGLGSWLASGRELLDGIVAAIIAGTMVGLGAGIGFVGWQMAVLAGERIPDATARSKGLSRGDKISGIGSGLIVGVETGLVVGFAVGLTTGLAVGFAFGVTAVLAGKLIPDSTSKVGHPKDLRRRDNISGISSGPLVGLVIGLAVGLTGELVFGMSGGIVAGIVFGILFGILYGLMYTEGWMTFVSQIYLRIRHRSPLRLGRFLEDAHARHLLRTVGPVYQFRHATLQDRLAPPSA